MIIDLEEGRHKISIGGRWSLEDLYVFPRAYEQVYFLFYSLLPHEDEWLQEQIRRAYARFPWRGGYSAVNFYDMLKYTTPRRSRPQVISLQYASPGWLELSIIIGVAVAVERVVKSIASTLKETNSTYHEIHKGLSERKLLRIEVERKELELARASHKYIEECVLGMAGMLDLNEVNQMHEKTGSSLKTLKIMLSLYRRLRTLAEYERKGKVKL